MDSQTPVEATAFCDSVSIAAETSGAEGLPLEPPPGEEEDDPAITRESQENSFRYKTVHSTGFAVPSP